MSSSPERLTMARVALEARAAHFARLGEPELAAKLVAYAQAVMIAITDPDALGTLGLARYDADTTARHLEAHDRNGEPARLLREVFDLLDSLLARDDPG